MRTHHVTGDGGITLHVDETGPESGRPILFVHGFSTSGLPWIYQLESTLAEEFRLLTVDLRGHGRSEKPENGYDDPERWAGDIHAVVTELGLDDLVVVASSMAGAFLCDFLSVHGEDGVTGINLVGAISTVGTDESAANVGTDFTELVPAFQSTDAAESFAGIDELWRRVPHEELHPRDHYFLVAATLQTPPRVRRELLRRRARYESLLSTIDTPVLVTHGEEDTIILRSAAEEHVDGIPNAEPSFYAGVGHAPFVEDPARFNRELREFVHSL